MGGQKRSAGSGVLTLHSGACFNFLDARLPVSRNFLLSKEAERKSEQNRARKGSWKNTVLPLCLSPMSTRSGGGWRVYTPGISAWRRWLKATDRTRLSLVRKWGSVHPSSRARVKSGFRRVLDGGGPQQCVFDTEMVA